MKSVRATLDSDPCRRVACRNESHFPALCIEPCTSSHEDCSIPDRHDNNTTVHMKTVALLTLYAAVLPRGA
jgi:hypothetical protein